MNDRDLCLMIELGEAVIIDRTDIEVAAFARPAEIKLRDSLGCKTGLQRVEGAGELSQLIVVQKLAIGHQQSGPAPHPFIAERELSGTLDSAAKRAGGRAVGAIARGEITGILLKDSGRSDRVRTVQ